jgi:glucose-fructose oxidoreductase
MRQLSIAIFASVLFSLAPHCLAQTQENTDSQSSRLRVAIVGLVHGHASGFFSQSLTRPDIQLVGIFEPDQQVFSRYQSEFHLDQALLFTNLEKMLLETRPQAVLVYTNTLDHRQVIEVCARHGVHVMMEKPLAVSMEDARAIERAAKQGRIHVLVNYETTWYRSNQAAYDLVHQQAIGEIRKVVIHDGHRGPKEIGVQPEFFVWLTDPKLNGGGALFDFGCYGADLMTWLMDGRRPDTVTAVTQHFKPDIYPRVDDEATIVLTYPKAQAIIQASWNWHFGRKDMEVYGQTGYAITVQQNDLRVRRGESAEEQVAPKPLPPPYNDSLSYLQAVLSGQVQSSGPSSLETNLVVTEILDAARRSAASGKTVRLAATK